MVEWNFFDKVYRRWLVVMIGDLDILKSDLTSWNFTEIELIVPSKGLCIELTDENNTGGQRCNIIWLPIWDTASLVHELTHLVMQIFSQVGVPVERDNTEAFAFYTEFWFNEITRGKRRHPNGRSPAIARRP